MRSSFSRAFFPAAIILLAALLLVGASVQMLMRNTVTKQSKERLQNETLLVQGVMDLLFEDADGNLVLCDYKTDRLRPTERRDPEAARRALWERHGRQLHYYALAVEQLFGRRPDAVLLYSTALGRAFDCVAEITP
jgi:ATP-dependent exoDNAse (exonuclease V) beta subunit